MPDFGSISQYVYNQQGATQNVRLNYQTFLDFVAAYYEWMEQSGGAVQRTFTVLDQRDIDKSLDQFLNYFYYEFLTDIPTTILADPRKLAKHIKDFYLARGAEKSYNLLFRILYNDTIGFYYPKVDMLRVSDGKWTVSTVIRTTTVNDTLSFISLPITGETSHATAYVENVVQLQIGADTVSEIYISSLNGTFAIGETVKVQIPGGALLTETTYGLATGITLTNPGTAYQSGDIIGVDGGNQTAVFSVDVTTGTVTGLVINAGLENFPQLPTIQFDGAASNVDGAYNGMFVTITDGPGEGQQKRITSYSGLSKVAIVDSNWLVLPTNQSSYSIALGQIITTKVNDFGINYNSPGASANFTISGNGDATGTITVGAIGYYAGHYITNDGFLSDRKYLQDSHYYQDFSYVLKTHETLVTYAGIVKKILHPSGLLLFGELILDGAALPRKVHTPSNAISINTFSGTLPVSSLEGQYSMIEDLTNTQLVYDDSSAFPNGNNAILGTRTVVELDDPSWVASTGVNFHNTFVNGRIIPVSNTQETIVVVFKAASLEDNAGIIGSIDTNNDAGVTGYQMYLLANGSIIFRAQKWNGTQNDIRIGYGGGSINTSNYNFASLRYLNNTLVGNLGTNPFVQTSYGTNVDGTSIISNSRGLYMGVGGYQRPTLSTLSGNGWGGSMLSGVQNGVTLGTLKNGFFDGTIAYVVVYNRYLLDTEISECYQFMKGIMVSRGLTLN